MHSADGVDFVSLKWSTDWKFNQNWSHYWLICVHLLHSVYIMWPQKYTQYKMKTNFHHTYL